MASFVENTNLHFNELLKLVTRRVVTGSLGKSSVIKALVININNPTNQPHSSLPQHPNNNVDTQETTNQTTTHSFCPNKEYNKKLEMLVFLGEDPCSWVFKAK